MRVSVNDFPRFMNSLPACFTFIYFPTFKLGKRAREKKARVECFAAAAPAESGIMFVLCEISKQKYSNRWKYIAIYPSKKRSSKGNEHDTIQQKGVYKGKMQN